jgi:hypothetical protein
VLSHLIRLSDSDSSRLMSIALLNVRFCPNISVRVARPFEDCLELALTCVDRFYI